MSMPTCPSCIYAQGICGKTGVSIRYSTGCTFHYPKAVTTNYEMLITKTPEEIAEILAKYTSLTELGMEACKEGWLDWLKEEAE